MFENYEKWKENLKVEIAQDIRLSKAMLKVLTAIEQISTDEGVKEEELWHFIGACCE